MHLGNLRFNKETLQINPNKSSIHAEVTEKGKYFKPLCSFVSPFNSCSSYITFPIKRIHTISHLVTVFIKCADALSAAEFPYSHSLVRTAWNKMLIVWRKGNTKYPGSMPWQSTCYVCMLSATHKSLLINQYSSTNEWTTDKTTDLDFCINQWMHEPSVLHKTNPCQSV